MSTAQAFVAEDPRVGARGIAGAEPRLRLALRQGTSAIGAPGALVERTVLAQALHGIRLEQHLMKQLHYNLLHRWFVGLPRDEAALDPTRSQQRHAGSNPMTVSRLAAALPL